MEFIFTQFCDRIINKVNNTTKYEKILIKVTSFLLVALLGFVISFVSCGITFGLNVVYKGKNIAVVSNTSVFQKATQYIKENTEHKEAVSSIDNAKYKPTVTLKDKFADKVALADAIVNNTDEIVSANIIMVNGEAVAFTDCQNIEEIIEQSRCRYYVEGAENSAEFIDKIELVECFSYVSHIDNIKDVKELVLNLDVKTVSKVSFEAPIAFSVKTVKTNKEHIGYSKITTPGKKGLASKVELVETINGSESSREVVKNEVLEQPVTQVVLKGTAVSTANATEKLEAQSAGFIYPLKNRVTASAYWGDGRGHKGMDLPDDKGTAIFASKGGVVTVASYRGNYGYMVEIDHGNGFKTRYAHNSALCVKVGQTVKQGQQIAKMGNTGRSTGSHLHFEILKNGVQVNPVLYIGK